MKSFLGLIAMYQEQLSEYNETTLTNAIKSIIKLPEPKVRIDYNVDSDNYEF